jgi:acetylornithine deacetylase/succinyl-diaminopimelate desuccinylase-like protein
MPQRRGPAEDGLAHGIDERISAGSLKFGIRALYDIVRRLAAE